MSQICKAATTTDKSILLHRCKKFLSGLMHNDFDISTCLNVMFVQQSLALELDFYEDLWCHRVKSTINIKDVVTPKIR